MKTRRIETKFLANPWGGAWGSFAANESTHGSLALDYAEEAMRTCAPEFLAAFEKGFTECFDHERQSRRDLPIFRIVVEELGVSHPMIAPRFQLLGAFAARDLIREVSANAAS